MPNPTPLNPDDEVCRDQTIFVYETAERDYPQHGSIMLKLHHNNFQSSLVQVSKRTAESLRDQLNDLLAVAQPVVNSVEELDKLPVGSVVLDPFGASATKVNLSASRPWLGESIQWFRVTSALETGYQYRRPFLPARVLYRPEVNDA